MFSHIVELLQDDDHVIVSNTVEMVKRILKKGGLEMIVNTPQMVASLVDVLNSSKDLETVNYTLKIILSLSECQTGLFSIYQSNGIPVLIQLLSASVESQLNLAIVILHNLLQNQEGSKAAISEAGGLQKLVSLLKHNDEKLLSIVIDCLRILAYRNQENKLLIFSSDGPAELVRILSTSSCQTLLYCTSGLLKILSACSINKSAIIAAGGMEALVKHLNNPSRELVINCLWTLRNLSDALNKQENVGSFLKILVQFLSNSDNSIVCCSAGILSNMTCNNVSNKAIVCQVRGISALVNVMCEAGISEETIESAIRTLRNLTRKHPKARKAQNAVRLHSGLQPIVKLLHHNSNLHLIKAVIELVRNLTLCPNNHEPLRVLGAVDILKNMLNFFYQYITEKRNAPSCYETQTSNIEDVRTEDIVEGIMGTLLNFAMNVNVRDLLKEDEIINTIVRILCIENENIQDIVASLFCEIASDPGGILVVESAGAIPFFCTFLNSKNQSLASKSQFLLIQLFNLKPKEYHFLSMELNNIIRENTSDPWNELLKSIQSGIPESGYLENQSPFSCPSGSISARNQGAILQPMQNPIFQEPEFLDIEVDLDIFSEIGLTPLLTYCDPT